MGKSLSTGRWRRITLAFLLFASRATPFSRVSQCVLHFDAHLAQTLLVGADTGQEEHARGQEVHASGRVELAADHRAEEAQTAQTDSEEVWHLLSQVAQSAHRFVNIVPHLQQAGAQLIKLLVILRRP